MALTLSRLTGSSLRDVRDMRLAHLIRYLKKLAEQAK